MAVPLMRPRAGATRIDPDERGAAVDGGRALCGPGGRDELVGRGGGIDVARGAGGIVGGRAAESSAAGRRDRRGRAPGSTAARAQARIASSRERTAGWRFASTTTRALDVVRGRGERLLERAAQEQQADRAPTRSARRSSCADTPRRCRPTTLGTNGGKVGSSRRIAAVVADPPRPNGGVPTTIS